MPGEALRSARAGRVRGGDGGPGPRAARTGLPRAEAGECYRRSPDEKGRRCGASSGPGSCPGRRSFEHAPRSPAEPLQSPPEPGRPPGGHQLCDWVTSENLCVCEIGVESPLHRALEGQQLPFRVATCQHGGHKRCLSPLTPPAPASSGCQPQGEVRPQPVLGLEGLGRRPGKSLGCGPGCGPGGQSCASRRREST